jgi:hypothetical protein
LIYGVLPARSFSSAISARAEAPRTRTTSGWFGTGFIYIQRSTVEICAIQLSDGCLSRLRFSHFDKSKTARLARVSVSNDVHALNAAIGSESREKIVLGSLITEISDKYICHDVNSFFDDLSLSDCSGTNLSEGKLAAGRHSKGDTDAGKDISSISGFRPDELLEGKLKLVEGEQRVTLTRRAPSGR